MDEEADALVSRDSEKQWQAMVTGGQRQLGAGDSAQQRRQDADVQVEVSAQARKSGEV